MEEENNWSGVDESDGEGERREQERSRDRESLMYICILMEKIHDKKIR